MYTLFILTKQTNFFTTNAEFNEESFSLQNENIPFRTEDIALT